MSTQKPTSANHPLKYEAIELTGKLKTSVPPSQLGKGDFSTLTNMRYTDASVEGVEGMTLVDTMPVLCPTVTAGIHYRKDQPSESHILTQSFNAGMSASRLADGFDYIYGGAAGAGRGKFSLAPDGCVAFGDGKETLLWGGDEFRVAGFIVADKDDSVGNAPTQIWDYTSEVNNPLSTSVDLAVVKSRYIHIASTRMLAGIKFYVSTPNASACTMAVSYWGGSSWVPVHALVDGTSVGGKALAQTGSVTFEKATATIRFFNNTSLYWYLIDLNGCDVTTKISYATVNAPFQQITDVWDSIPRQIASFQAYDGTKYSTYTTNVFREDFVAGSATTYVDFNGFLTTQHVLAGFTEKMMGIKFKIVPGYVNSATASMTVSCWDGSAWNPLIVFDGTATGGVTFSKSGVVTWTPPASGLEFPTSVSNQDLFYYYKISFTGNLSANAIILDNIEAIPKQSTLDSFKFPAMFQNRLVLCNDQLGDKNSILISSRDTNCVFNGSDSTKLLFGDSTEIVAATNYFTRISNTYYENLVVLKNDSAWVVDGTTTSTFNVFNISRMYGCAAPATLAACDLGFTQSVGMARPVLIWVSSTGVVMWDGSTVFPIDGDVDDLFNPAKPTSLNFAKLSESFAWFDERRKEWHWCFAGHDSSTVNKEMVFDLVRKKWFEIQRGTHPLCYGFSVTDSNKSKQVYGFTTDGKVELLESGQTFDGDAITSTVETGDIPLGGWMHQTAMRKVKVLARAKNSTPNQLNMLYYGDCATAATATQTYPMAATASTIIQPIRSVHWGNFTFHRFKLQLTTSNETTGFEPVGIGVFYKLIREDVA